MLQKRMSPEIFFPFGGGVRRCIGAAFATYEIKIVVAYVLKHFNLLFKPGYQMKVARRGVTFAPSKGLPVTASRKTDN